MSQKRGCSVIRKLLKNKFGRSIALLTGGTLVAQVINTLLSPIITRIYPPEEYGVLSAFVAVLGILTVIASLNYHVAIPIIDDEDDAINTFALSFLVLIVISIILSLLMFFIGDEILLFFGQEVLSQYKYWIPLGVLFFGGYIILNQW